MNVLPQDLGEKRCQLVAAQRAGVMPPASGIDLSVGFWGRRWLRKRHGSVSSEEVLTLHASRVPARAWSFLGLLPSLAGIGMGLATISGYLTSPYAYHDPVPALLGFGGGGACGWFCAIVQPRRALKSKHRQIYGQPLTGAEIAALLPQTHDELERSYLTLVMDVVRQEIRPAAGADLQAALRSLGDAIDKLPATRVVISTDHDIMTEVLQRTAAETLRRAQEEPDRIVAASLMRRVEALHRRADATKRANTLVRRFSVLRQEMAAETEALRAGLSAYYTGAHDIADLTHLAEDMQRLASEAAAITAAVEEVDSIPSGIPVIPQVPAVTRIQLG